MIEFDRIGLLNIGEEAVELQQSHCHRERGRLEFGAARFGDDHVCVVGGCDAATAAREDQGQLRPRTRALELALCFSNLESQKILLMGCLNR